MVQHVIVIILTPQCGHGVDRGRSTRRNHTRGECSKENRNQPSPGPFGLTPDPHVQIVHLTIGLLIGIDGDDLPANAMQNG